ncbi:MAG: putative sulfate/molybdate transporter [Promethearchaeota archaeon]
MVGYIAIIGMDPSGVLIGFGLVHVLLAVVYKLPLPVQPMKVISSVVIAEKWSKNQIFGAGFSMGIVLVILSFSDRINRIFNRIPNSVVKGIQLSLVFKLLLTGGRMTSSNLILGLLLLGSAFLMLRNSVIPSSMFLILFGFLYSIFTGQLRFEDINFGVSFPSYHLFSFNDVMQGFVSVGLGQLPLTLTNAVVATAALIRDLFPERLDVSTKKLLVNMGVINLFSPFIGCIPVCHGAGGLSAHYSFGARTGGSILLLGLIEIALGLFFSSSLVLLFSALPLFVLGVMLVISSLSLLNSVIMLRGTLNIAVTIFTALVSVMVNLSTGLIFGLIFNYGIKKRLFKNIESFWRSLNC